MPDPIIYFFVLIALSSNFLSFALGTGFALKSKVLGPAAVFTVVQLLLFIIGWGLARLLIPMVTGHEAMIFHSIILFLGIKRTVRFFTVKKDARSFRLIHIFDVAGVATAVAIDAMIFGLGLGMVQEHPLNTLFLLAAITLAMGVFGVAVKRKMAVKDNGALVELLSGVILVIISIYILIK